MLLGTGVARLALAIPPPKKKLHNHVKQLLIES